MKRYVTVQLIETQLGIALVHQALEIRGHLGGYLAITRKQHRTYGVEVALGPRRITLQHWPRWRVMNEFTALTQKNSSLAVTGSGSHRRRIEVANGCVHHDRGVRGTFVEYANK